MICSASRNICWAWQVLRMNLADFPQPNLLISKLKYLFSGLVLCSWEILTLQIALYWGLCLVFFARKRKKVFIRDSWFRPKIIHDERILQNGKQVSGIYEPVQGVICVLNYMWPLNLFCPLMKKLRFLLDLVHKKIDLKSVFSFIFITCKMLFLVYVTSIKQDQDPPSLPLPGYPLY